MMQRRTRIRIELEWQKKDKGERKYSAKKKELGRQRRKVRKQRAEEEEIKLFKLRPDVKSPGTV